MRTPTPASLHAYPVDGTLPADVAEAMAAGALPPLPGRLSAHTVELPAYAPGQAIDQGYVVREPTRGIRPRRRSRLQRVLIGLSSGTLLLIVGGVLTLATLFSPLGARRAARLAAEQELTAELDEGERVLGRAFVSQRRWEDNFRESFGVLAATDRRLLYVGVPPQPWLRQDDAEGPPELRVQGVTYDIPFVAGAHRQLLGLARGVEVRTPAGPEAFLVPRGEAPRVREIERVVERALQARTEALRREQAARVQPPPPAPVYGVHVVRPGEALSTIARRYRTSPDVLRQLNRLTADGIRIGQRLRVPLPPEQADSAAAPAPAGAAPGAPQAITY